MATYASLNEAKSYLRITDTVDDTLIQLALDASTEAIDLVCRGPLAESLAITGTATTDLINRVAHGLPAGEPVQFTALTGGTGLTVGTQYFVISPLADTFQVSLVVGGVAALFTADITAGQLVQLWQFSPVPPMVKQACLIQTARWFKRQDAPFGVLGSPEFGNYTRLQAALDPDVQMMLSGHGDRLRWGTTV